ncbi:MAG: hypothetical protein U0401_15205 [Anaerolineae bacterium]
MATTPNVTEHWLRLMSEAMRGAADAQEAIRSLGEMPTTPDQLTRWFTRFMPMSGLGATAATPDAFKDWLEDSWRMMGVVPRYRYLELLERYELLRQRLEEAEKKIQKMRTTMLIDKVPEQEAQKVLDMWEGMLQDTLKLQADWMRAWTASGEKKDSSEEASRKETTDIGQDKK